MLKNPKKRSEQQREWLIDGKTLSGLPLTVPRTDPQNYSRAVVAGVQDQLSYIGAGGLESPPDGSVDPASDDAHWAALKRIAVSSDALALARLDPTHYGDSTPGLSTASHVPIFPDPVFTHWDLIQFGLGVSASAIVISSASRTLTRG